MSVAQLPSGWYTRLIYVHRNGRATRHRGYSNACAICLCRCMCVYPDVESVCVNSAARAHIGWLERKGKRERESRRESLHTAARKDHPDYPVHTTGRAHREQFKGERSKRSVFTSPLLQVRNFHCPPCPSACPSLLSPTINSNVKGEFTIRTGFDLAFFYIGTELDNCYLGKYPGPSAFCKLTYGWFGEIKDTRETDLRVTQMRGWYLKGGFVNRRHCDKLSESLRMTDIDSIEINMLS